MGLFPIPFLPPPFIPFSTGLIPVPTCFTILPFFHSFLSIPTYRVTLFVDLLFLGPGVCSYHLPFHWLLDIPLDHSTGFSTNSGEIPAPTSRPSPFPSELARLNFFLRPSQPTPASVPASQLAPLNWLLPPPPATTSGEKFPSV